MRIIIVSDHLNIECHDIVASKHTVGRFSQSKSVKCPIIISADPCAFFLFTEEFLPRRE